jgi:CRISPR-associated protein Cmr4
VRSAKGSFAWITCPLALARYARDAKPEGKDGKVPQARFHGLTETPRNGSVTVLAGSEVTLDGGQVVLEEYTYDAASEKGDAAGKAQFSEMSELLKNWESHLVGLDGLGEDAVWRLLPGRLVVVPDGIFSFYVQSGCEIAQHVAINDATGTAQDKALFNQENCPAETLFYGVMSAQEINGKPADGENGALAKLASLNGKPLQIGGGETTGLGWCSFIFNLTQSQ